MRKLSILLSVFSLLFAVIISACSNQNEGASNNVVDSKPKDPSELSGEIELWSWFDTAKYTVDKFQAKFPNIKVNLTIIPSAEYKTKLMSALTAGAGAPDVILLEANFLGSMIDHPALQDLSNYDTAELLADQYDYVSKVSTDSKGKLKALSYQATPGGFYFRRDLAKQYLGTDDPKEVSKAISSWDKLMALGERINKESGGKHNALPSWSDLIAVQVGKKSKPWVVDGKLVVAPEILEAYDLAKQARDHKAEASLAEGPGMFSGNAGTFASMQKGTVLFYPLPTWALNYYIANNAPDTKGQWGLAHGPAEFFSGGTWISIYSGSKKKALAWEMIKYWTGKEFLKMNSAERLDFANNKSVMKEMASTAKGHDFLAGQNYFEFFNDAALSIKTAPITKYDLEINTMLVNSVKLYVNGKATKEKAIEQLKADVKNSFPEIDVK